MPRIRFSAVVLLPLMIVGCWNNDYAITLPNNYSLVRSNDIELYITDNKGSFAVYGKILSYAIVSNELVVGENSIPAEMADFQKQVTSPAGFFIVDTKHSHTITGLSRQSWKSEVSKLGHKPPDLIEPDCPRNAIGFCTQQHQKNK